MNRYGYYSVICLLFICSGTLFARTGTITGKVINGQGKPVSDVSMVVLKAGDSTLAKAGYTDDKGQYSIGPVADGNYVIKAISLGYKTYGSAIFSVSGTAVSIPDISLIPDNGDLQEVSVRAQKPFIEVRPDMLVVNVENSIVNAGSSAYDVLSRSPGVIIDQNDNISLKGKQGVTIMINDKIQPMTGDDLANILKGMPSGAIEKIELISNPSAKYDATGGAGIINIVMKKDQRMGANGSVNGGYGQGVYPKANGGFNLNYRGKKINLYANYNYAFREGFNTLTLTRNFYADSLRYNQAHLATFPFQSHTANIGLDCNLTSKTILGIALNGNNTSYVSSGTVLNHVTNSVTGMPQYDENTSTGSNNNWNDYEIDINLKHHFDTTARLLTVDADYIRFWNLNTQTLNTTYGYYAPGISQPPYILYANVTGLTQIRSVRADYEMPIFQGGKFETGIKSSFVTSDNQPSFYDESAGQPVFDPTKSDHFIYTENINAAYINASKDFGKWSTQLGLRAEQTNNKGLEKADDSSFTNSYIQLFPSLALQRHLDKDNDVGITLSRRIQRPTYRQLNPYKFYTDPTTVKEGDPTIKPELTYSAEASHTYKQRFVTTFLYSVTSNPITQLLLPVLANSVNEDNLTVQTEKNLTRMIYYGISGAYTIPFYKWWTSVITFNAYYDKYQGDLANTNLDKGMPTFDINTTNSFILPKNFSAELSYYYQAEQLYGYFDLKPMSMLNFGIQKNIWNKKATIRFNGTDILWHGYPSAISHYTGYDESFTAKRDTRQFTLAFTYRFGKNTVPQIRRHSSGAEEEKQRASDTAG